jgi:hypothetical protein
MLRKIRFVPRLVAVIAVSSAAGCHGGRAGVAFSGNARAPVVSPNQVIEVRALPRGAARLGRLHAQCEALDSWEAFEGRSLADVDCSESRLRWMLRDAAAENGGDVLAAVTCRSGTSSSCSALLGRTARAPEPARALALRPDVQGVRGAAVRVDFAPLGAVPPRSPRHAESVNELATLPPSHRVVGSFSTECVECSELETRDALRVAAGRLGASDVVGVRCVPWGPGFQCAGSAAVTLVEP